MFFLVCFLYNRVRAMGDGRFFGLCINSAREAWEFGACLILGFWGYTLA